MIGFQRFLIFTAIYFFLGFGAWSLLAFESSGSVATLVLGVAFFLGAIGLGYYLNHLAKLYLYEYLIRLSNFEESNIVSPDSIAHSRSGQSENPTFTWYFSAIWTATS